MVLWVLKLIPNELVQQLENPELIKKIIKKSSFSKVFLVTFFMIFTLVLDFQATESTHLG